MNAALGFLFFVAIGYLLSIKLGVLLQQSAGTDSARLRQPE
jgi:hypothetical protein